MPFREVLARVPRRSVAVYLVAVALLGAWTVFAVRSANHRSPHSYGAIETFWISGSAANRHTNPYAPAASSPRFNTFTPMGQQVELNLNPPVLIPAFQLLAKVPRPAAFAGWSTASFLLFAVTLGYLLCQNPAMPEGVIVSLAIGGSLLDTQWVGQLYVLLLALATVAWWAMQKRRDVCAALAIGLIVAIKPPFALWPLFLLLAGRRRLALLSACVAGALSAFPLVIYGTVIYNQWLDAVTGDLHYTAGLNVSIPAVLHRLGHPAAGFGVAAALLVFLCALAIRYKPDAVTASGIGILAGILCSPLAWVQYVMLLFPVIATTPRHPRKDWGVLMLAVPSFVPNVLLLCDDRRRFLPHLFFFVPCWLLLGWMIETMLAGQYHGLKSLAVALSPHDAAIETVNACELV